MPSRPREVPTLFSQLLGVNVTVDPGALPPTLLQFAENWVPSQRFTLIRRPGTVPYPSILFSESVHALIRFTRGATRYLYAVATPASGGDVVYVSTDDGLWFAAAGDATFTKRGGDYGFARYGDFLYVGNGEDPLKQVEIGGSSIDLVPLATFENTQGEPTISDDPGSHLLTGTYSYAWAIYNTDTKRWVAVQSNPRTFSISAANDKSVLIPLPLLTDYTLGANEQHHLFVAPVNLPIEFAYDQFPAGVTTFAATLRAIIVEDQPIPLTSAITRRGRFLIAHRGRVWMSGDRTSPENARRVWATSTILPGLEQAIYDRGAFFPALAELQIPSGDITALNVVSLSGGRTDPTAPVAIQTTTQTWLFFGDILGDPGAALVQRSDRIGCISNDAAVGTPIGLLFPGLDSVYLLTPNGDLLDVGWTIASVIKAIPPARRAQTIAVYHDGFYKLFLSPRGSLVNTESWWLDLRQGLGSIPSWWGPHRLGTLTAAPETIAVGTEEARRAERLFGLAMNGTGLELGLSTTDLGSAFLARLRTGLIDLGKPFDRKNATRARVIARPGATTTLSIKVQVDGNQVEDFGDVTLTATGAQWNVDDWNVAQWGTSFFQEGDARAEADRPRGLSFALQVEHNAPQTIELRDAELALIPVVRPTAE